MPSQLHIRAMTMHDLDFADRLRDGAGWNQRPEDWARLLRYEPEGCFLAEWNREPAATVTTTRYGSDLAWIGMMLVNPAFRRRGIATALMEEALDYLRECRVKCIKLDATPEGRKVYEKLGFREEGMLHRWEWDGEGKPNGSAGFAAEKVRQECPSSAKTLDLEAFGAERTRWLKDLAEGAKCVRMHRNEEGEALAFGMLRPGARADYLGPAVAADVSAAELVIEDLLGARTRKTLWDVPQANEEAVELAEKHGFNRTRSILRMWTGEEHVKGKPKMQFAIADPSTG